MPPPSGPEIVVQCYWGNATRVADAIAAGADLLQVTEPACPACSPEKYGIPDPRHGIALHWACNYAHVDCVRALLATGCSEQLDWARATSGATPLILLCQNAGRAALPMNPNQLADTLPCVELLLEAGAALEPKTTDTYRCHYPVGSPSAEALRGRVLHSPLAAAQGQRLSPSGLTALDFAYLSGNNDLVRALEDAASLRYSVRTHSRFPRPARYAAARALRLGYQIKQGALLSVWANSVLPFLISRTSGICTRSSRKRPRVHEPGDRVKDIDGRAGVVTEVENGCFKVRFDDDSDNTGGRFPWFQGNQELFPEASSLPAAAVAAAAEKKKKKKKKKQKHASSTSEAAR